MLGERALERRRIVSTDRVVADDGDRDGSKSAGHELVVRAIVLVDVLRREADAFA